MDCSASIKHKHKLTVGYALLACLPDRIRKIHLGCIFSTTDRSFDFNSLSSFSRFHPTEELQIETGFVIPAVEAQKFARCKNASRLKDYDDRILGASPTSEIPFALLHEQNFKLLPWTYMLFPPPLDNSDYFPEIIPWTDNISTKAKKAIKQELIRAIDQNTDHLPSLASLPQQHENHNGNNIYSAY